ncbi:MAG: hypothetical protein K9L28_09475 [Synergistales bacterium]|nr:hypothetical protein [Synergistales bacterium]
MLTDYPERCSTVITGVERHSRKRYTLRLAETPFRPEGGGQPGDGGRLESEDFSGSVTGCTSNADGAHLLDVKPRRGTPQEGDAVEATVDLARRGRYARMHTGEHILSRILERTCPGLSIGKVAIGGEHSTVFLRYDGDLTWEALFEAERGAADVIGRNLPVECRVLSPAEAWERGLRAKWDRLDDEPVRMISIRGFDRIACSGSHVPFTGQVGAVVVTGFKGSPPEWQVSFTVDGEVAAEGSRRMRMLERELATPAAKIPGLVAKRRDEAAGARKALDKVKQYLAFPWEREELPGGWRLHALVLAGIPGELVTPALKRIITDDDGAVGCVLLQEGDGPEAQVLLARGGSCPLDARTVVRRAELQAKGGGAPEWVSGKTGCTSVRLWKKAIADELA